MTDVLALDRRPRPRPDVETAFVAGEAVLLDVATGSVFALSPSASAVWLLIDGESSASDIAADLSNIVGLSAQTLAPDVEVAMDGFAQQGLLVAESTPQQPPSEPFPLYPPPDP